MLTLSERYAVIKTRYVHLHREHWQTAPLAVLERYRRMYHLAWHRLLVRQRMGLA